MSSNPDSAALTSPRRAARTLLLLGATGLGALTLSATASAQTAPKPAATSAATSQATSAVAIEISAAIKGQIVGCPASLKLSPRAVCLYAQSAVASLRPLIAGKLSGRAVGTWKTTGKASTLLVRERANGPLGAFVLLSALNDKESLVVVDAAQAKATPDRRQTGHSGRCGQGSVLRAGPRSGRRGQRDQPGRRQITA